MKFLQESLTNFVINKIEEKISREGSWKKVSLDEYLFPVEKEFFCICSVS